MIRKEFELQVQKLTLRGQYYETQNPIAVVVLVHGMGEYARRYEKTVVAALLNASIAVVSYDQFGHGNSEGKKGDNPGYTYLLDAVDLIISKAQEEFHALPVFLYGHSMGGNVVINYTLQRENKLQGVIATSPFLKLAFEPPAWKMIFGKIIAKVYPSLTMPNELNPDFISKDKEEIEAYINDPLIHDRISPRYSLDVMEHGKWAIENAKRLATPMLLFHGEKDTITSSKASTYFAEKAGDQVTFIPFKNGYHELHNDIERKELFEYVVQWIHKRITIT